jgi:hypothetical protein
MLSGSCLLSRDMEPRVRPQHRQRISRRSQDEECKSPVRTSPHSSSTDADVLKSSTDNV